MTDYSDLLTNVRNYTETSSDVLSDSVLNTFIVNVENKLFKEVDLSYYRKYDTANLTVDIAFLSLPGDWRATRYLQIVDVNLGGGVRTTLLQKDISFMTEYWPDRTATGTPKYYADWDQNTHYIAPTPSSNMAVELAYLRMPDNLSASNTSTWISQNAPNVLLYGCILEGLGYLKGPTDMIQLYDKKYNQSLKDLATYEMGRDRRDEYRDGVIRVPLESRNP